MNLHVRLKLGWALLALGGLLMLAGCQMPAPGGPTAGPPTLTGLSSPPPRSGHVCGGSCTSNLDCQTGYTCQDAGVVSTDNMKPFVAARQCWAASCGGGTGGCGQTCNVSMDCGPGMTCTTLPGQNGKFCYSHACTTGVAQTAPTRTCICGAVPSDGSGSQWCADGSYNENAADCEPGATPVPAHTGGCQSLCNSNADCANGFSCKEMQESTLDGRVITAPSECWATACINGGAGQGGACGAGQPPCAVGLTCTPGSGGASTCQPIPPAQTGLPAAGQCGAACDPLQGCGLAYDPTPVNECTDWVVLDTNFPFLTNSFYRCLDANNDHTCDSNGVPCADPSQCSLDGSCGSTTMECSSYTAPLPGCAVGACLPGPSGAWTCGGGACLNVPHVPPRATLTVHVTLVPTVGAPPPSGPSPTAGVTPTAEALNCFCEVDPNTNAWDGTQVCNRPDGTFDHSTVDTTTCPLPTGGGSGGKKPGGKPCPCVGGLNVCTKKKC